VCRVSPSLRFASLFGLPIWKLPRGIFAKSAAYPGLAIKSGTNIVNNNFILIFLLLPEMGRAR